jgi:hypothetical protein
LNDDATFAKQSTDAIANNLQTGIRIFPNPVANNFLRITIDKTYSTTIKCMMYNANGNVVKLQLVAANTGNINLDISALANGNYFLVLTDGLQLNHKEKILVSH